MYVEAVKEPFDHDSGFAVVNGAVQIEKHERLAEANRELVSRFALTKAPSGVSHQNPILVVNREDYPTFHRAFTGVEAYAEVGGRVRVYPAQDEVRVIRISAPEFKG